MAVKFPLKMADGATVRTIKELQDHFDLATVLSYYENGRLVKWLENGYYDEEARKVAALDSASPDFAEKICEILGVSCSVSERAQVDLDDISERNKRLEHLKQFTADDEILMAVDRTAFTQVELDDLVSKYGWPVKNLYKTSYIPTPDDFQDNKVYLCGDYFAIPSDKCAIIYIGVNHPKIALTPVPKVSAEMFGFDADCSFLHFARSAPLVRNVEFDMDNLAEFVVDAKEDIAWYGPPSTSSELSVHDVIKLIIKLLERGEV